MSRIGEKIKEERQKNGLSPKQLGKKCGVSESYILEIETGKKIINEKFIKQVSKVLGKNIEENLIQEPEKTEIKDQKTSKNIEKPRSKAVHEVNPVGQWTEALSGIIKKIPIYDINMEERGYKSFPIINKKVEGYNPEKLIYIKVPNDNLKGFRIQRDDLILIYLNHELINNSISLVEQDGQLKLRKVKKLSGNKVELIGFNQDVKSNKVELNSIKVVGRGLRLEIEL